MNNLMNRIMTQWKTSVMGFILLITGIVLLCINKINFSQFMVFMPFVAGFFLAKDDIFPKGGAPMAATSIITALLLTGFTSCVTFEKCAEKYGLQHDTVERVIIKTVYPDSIKTRIIFNTLYKMQSGETVYVRQPNNRAEIKYWKDRYGEAINIQANCDTVKIHDTITIEVVKTSEGKILKATDKQPSRLQTFVTGMLIVLLIMGLLMGVKAIASKIIK